MSSVEAASTMSIPRCSVSALLLFSRRIAWESLFENVISERVKRVWLNVRGSSLSWEFLTVNSPIRKNPAKATLAAASKFKSSIFPDETTLLVSSLKIDLVIGAACLRASVGSTLRMPVMIRRSQGLSKTVVSSSRSTCIERNAERFPWIVSALTFGMPAPPMARNCRKLP